MKNQTKQIAIYLVFTFIVLLFTQSCSSKLETEANQELAKLLNSMLTKCDDLYSGSNGTFTIQFKNPAFKVLKSVPLDEADKLNDVEWKGIADFSCSSYRLITTPKGIGQWQTCPTTIRKDSQDDYLFFDSVGTGLVMGKVKGAWQLQSKHSVKPSDCNNTVPSLK